MYVSCVSNDENMDPSEAELDQLTSFEAGRRWIGMSEHVFEGLIEELGCRASCKMWRDIAAVDADDWKPCVADVMVQPPAEQGQEPPPKRKLKPVEKGHCHLFRRIARLRMGEPASDEPAQPTPALPALSQQGYRIA